MSFDDDVNGNPIVYALRLDPTQDDPNDYESWAAFLATVRVGGGLPVTFRPDDGYVIAEMIVPNAVPAPAARDTVGPGTIRIPLQIAEGFPVPLVTRFKLPSFSPKGAADFVRYIVRELYQHEADEQLRVGDSRPFAPEH